MVAGPVGKNLHQSVFAMFKSGIVLSLLCFLFVLAGVSQEQEWDSTYRPDIYPSRVGLFKSFKHSTNDIVLLGNSIIFWGEWSELARNSHLKNRGIPGDITFGVLDRLDEVINGKPAKVFVLIGINDVARNIPDSVVLHNYKRMIQRIKAGSPRTKIFFHTMLPTNSSFNKLTTHYNKGEHIKKINAGLKELGAKENIIVIDLYSAFADADGNLIRNITFDGVHLTEEGYYKWIALLKQGNYLK